MHPPDPPPLAMDRHTAAADPHADALVAVAAAYAAASAANAAAATVAAGPYAVVSGAAAAACAAADAANAAAAAAAAASAAAAATRAAANATAAATRAAADATAAADVTTADELPSYEEMEADAASAAVPPQARPTPPRSRSPSPWWRAAQPRRPRSADVAWPRVMVTWRPPVLPPPPDDPRWRLGIQGHREQGRPIDAHLLRVDPRWPLSYVSLCTGIPQNELEWMRYISSSSNSGPPLPWQCQEYPKRLSPDSEAREHQKQRRAAWRSGSPDIVDMVRKAAADREAAAAVARGAAPKPAADHS